MVSGSDITWIDNCDHQKSPEILFVESNQIWDVVSNHRRDKFRVVNLDALYPINSKPSFARQ